jgi:hypothetical protein
LTQSQTSSKSILFLNGKKIGLYPAGVNESLMDPGYPVFDMRNLGTFLDKYNDHPSVKTKIHFPGVTDSLAHGRLWFV